MKFEFNYTKGYKGKIVFGEELDNDKELLLLIETEGFCANQYFSLEQVKQLHEHLGLVIDKYENDGVTIYERVATQINVEDAISGSAKPGLKNSEVARVIDTYKKLGGV